MSSLSEDRIRELCQSGQKVIQTEAEALFTLAGQLTPEFAYACEYLLACEGRIIVLGMGKSGHIGNKIAATLASTGSPAFFVHPSEASHGDLGMITAKDVILALSYSGETDEITFILPLIKRLHLPLISITGNSVSTLAKAATVHLNIHVQKEACPLGLAPTSSTIATLAMGDALAITLLEMRGFTAHDFARSHPGGRLGRRLLLHVQDLMHTGEELPAVALNTTVADALIEMTRKRLGMTTILASDNRLLGIFTDGDLRRSLDKKIDLQSTLVQEVMSLHAKTITPDALAVDALNIMDTYKISVLVVLNDQQQAVGAIQLYDLLRAGVV